MYVCSDLILSSVHGPLGYQRVESGRGHYTRIPSSLLHHFNERIAFCSLHDLKSVGNSFSWCNQSVGAKRIMAQLDRALVNEEWISSFPGSLLQYEAQ